MSKHTNGPWRVGNEISGKVYNPYLILRSDSNAAVAQVYGIASNRSLDEQDDHPQTLEGIANARLIAAAPELLRALEIASYWIAEGRPAPSKVVDLVERAIAKATTP